MQRVRARAAEMAGALLARCGLLACLLGFAALVAPASAWAGVAPRVVVNKKAQAVTATQELVTGVVNPKGQSTTYQLDYARTGTQWCNNQSGTPSRTSNVTLRATDSVEHPVSVVVGGLTSGTTYCAELAATNGTGTGVGTATDDPGDTTPLVITFTAGVPTVTTSEVDPTGPQQISLQGTVDPASQSTSYTAVYDDASSAWCQSDGASGSPSFQSTAHQLPDQNPGAHAVAFYVTFNDPSPLSPDTDYCVAIAARNASSDTSGAQVIGDDDGVQTVTTLPEAVDDTVQSTSATAAQLSGQVNPDATSTTYWAAYGPVGSDWCQSDAASGSPASQTTPVTYPGQDQSAHDVTVDLTGLTTGTTYCAVLRSSNPHSGPSQAAVDDQDHPLPVFTAGLPTATTSDVAADAPTTAVLDGTVGPSGQSTTYDVMYDLQSSIWCLSGGTQGTATYLSGPQLLPHTDSAVYPVSVEVPALTPGAHYCAALAATNASNGQSGSPPVSVGTPIAFDAGFIPDAGAPSVTDQTASTSLVSASVNAEGQSTQYHIAYDTADSGWCTGAPGATPGFTTAGQAVSPADTSDHPIQVTVGALQGGVTYCAAVVATNSSGPFTGSQVQFVAGLPSASAAAGSPASATSETVTGTVTATSQATSYYAAYDAESSPWCENGGTPAGAASFTTSPTTLGALDSAAHTVSVTIDGLAPGEVYCAELVATNGSGTSPASAPQTFTAGFPFTVSTSSVSDLTSSSVTVNGTVDPAGLATSYWVAYDLQDSDWCSSGGQDGLAGLATSPVALAAIDSAPHAVAASVSGLTPGTAYCAALVGANDIGTSSGEQVSFTTSAAPAAGAATETSPPTPVAPTRTRGARPSKVAIRTASATSPTDATAFATIDPMGQKTFYHAAYAPAASPFCVAGGVGGHPQSTRRAVVPFADSAAHRVPVSLSGLSAGTRYCVQIVASNPAGTTRSPVAVFTTIAGPQVSALHLAPATFAAATRRLATVTGPGDGAGTRVSYRDSGAGTVTFSVTHAHAAHDGRDACHATSAHACAAAGVLGHFTRRTGAGDDRFTFTGRLHDRPLPRGRYELEAVAGDRWGLSSPTVTVRFTIR